MCLGEKLRSLLWRPAQEEARLRCDVGELPEVLAAVRKHG